MKYFKKNQLIATCLFVLGTAANCAWADWTFDFSRRTKAGANSASGSASMPAEDSSAADPTMNQMNQMNQVNQVSHEEGDRSIFSRIFSSTSDEPAQEIVIMQTELGFVPKKVQVRQGFTYKISIVNVNEKERNVSFVLDAFSEHHATYYGKIKSFIIHPQQDGVFSYQSPETAFQGQLVVVPSDMPKSPLEEIKLKSESKPTELPPPITTELRVPASQE